MGIDRLNQVEITNDDVAWVESIMGFQFNGDRLNIIKNLESVDIQAFPGSGKTTILIAKLAILAKKWPYTNSGICVLSHTNVAREEIEERLGNTDVGKKLLQYPHFIGTLHSFFDTFVALPWLRSQGISINMIDSDLVKKSRWLMLPFNTRAYLERNHKDAQICSYSESIGHIDWDKQGETRDKILDAIQRSQSNGNFTFDEMMLFAKQALKECDSLPVGLQQRFPVVFIDEAQDTNSFQWELLHTVFPQAGELTVQQGFGDCNQAIYNYINETVEKLEFPRNEPLLLNESQRFDNRIAKLANTVAVSTAQLCGATNKFSERECCHTIFLFSKNKAAQVIDAFGQLVLDTFSDEDLINEKRTGCHVIGAVHVKKEETPERQFPKGIYDYWPDYNSNKANKNQNPSKMIDYIRMGHATFETSGEMADLVEWLAKGVRKLINRAANSNLIAATGNPFSAIIKPLPEAKQLVIRNDFFRVSSAAITNEEEWTAVVHILENILSAFDLNVNEKVRNFLLWTNETVLCSKHQTTAQELPNHYIYTDQGGRCVDLEFGSIHSVKGRTQLATLVVETYSNTHNMKAILKYLCGKTPKMKDSDQSRLKCQYVAMTRAKALLCLAMPIEFVDDNAQALLEAKGWLIMKVI